MSRSHDEFVKCSRAQPLFGSTTPGEDPHLWRFVAEENGWPRGVIRDCGDKCEPRTLGEVHRLLLNAGRKVRKASE